VFIMIARVILSIYSLAFKKIESIIAIKRRHWISLVWRLKRFQNNESSKTYEVEVNPPKLALS